MLEIRETANSDFLGLNYDVRIYSNPSELKEEIKKLNKEKNKSRVVAGYCWDWIKDHRSDSAHFDITLPEYNFGMSWNLDNTATWAIDEKSVNEAGCIHTCQGLEFDYVGVIIGEDLIYRNGQVVTDRSKRARTDQSLRGLSQMLRENLVEAEQLADDIIRNTYRTLMTRGQKGCFIFCVDEDLGEYLSKRISRVSHVYKQNEFFRSSIIT